jgi:hypothetical protein
MIDKLDLRIRPRMPFTSEFDRVYSKLRAMDRGPFRAAKYYEYSGDLREYGYNVRLSLYCSMNETGNHKLELFDVGEMNRTQILREITQIFDVDDPLSLPVMRVDFAVDVPGVPLEWFRETVRVEHKRFRAAVTGEPFYSEMGKGRIQTLYFGKRPKLIRIYDKHAEYQEQYRTLVRKLGKDVKPPSFESVFGISDPNSILTRVERQIGGSIPTEVGTLKQLVEPNFEFEPFEKLRIIDHPVTPEVDSNLSFETRCTGLHLRSVARDEGMQAANAFISKYSNGNASWVRKKYQSFLASTSSADGITEADLQRRFRESMARQMRW